MLCDIHVPTNSAARKKFAERTPVFKNCEISQTDIGPYIRQVVDDEIRRFEKNGKILDWQLSRRQDLISYATSPMVFEQQT